MGCGVGCSQEVVRSNDFSYVKKNCFLSVGDFTMFDFSILLMKMSGKGSFLKIICEYNTF